MNLYKQHTANPYFCLVKDTNLASDNPLRFRYNFLERIKILIMTTDGNIIDQKLNMILTEAAKILALSSSKIDKYQYLTGEETLPLNRSEKVIFRKSF